ncbi:hypothetical protein AB0D59_43410 [Streptomyces sp. NPDC048417]
MQHRITAPVTGTLSELRVVVGQQVEPGPPTSRGPTA